VNGEMMSRLKSIKIHESIYNEGPHWAQLPIQDYTCELSNLPVATTLLSPAQVCFIYQKRIAVNVKLR
jgi:hypothetical protein